MSEKKEKALKLTLRLLNSSLRGCEFHLPAGKTLFLVKAESDIVSLSGMPDLPEDAIYIPLAEGGINFEVVASENATSVTIRALAVDNAKEIDCAFQSVCKVGTLEFAIKPLSDPWGKQVLNYDKQPSAPPRPVAAPIVKSNFSLKWIGAIVALGLALLAASQWWMGSSKAQVDELSTVLSGSVEKLQILSGRDGVFYVFANSDRDASWAKQTLIRNGSSKPVRVSTYREEAQRVTRQLELDSPLFAYYVLRLEKPEQPKLYFSYERVSLNAAGRDALVKKMMQWMPYVNKVEMIPIADADIVHQAKSGLDGLGIAYTQINRPSAVVFLIEGALEDAELQKARTFVEGFYRQWGDNYVQFSITLKDDPLKDKSFSFGSGGYVKLAPSHWYFPKEF